MYAKLKQGLSNKFLAYAPSTFITPNGEVIKDFPNNIDKLEEYGYKQIIDNRPDLININDQLIIDDFIEDEKTITIVYNIVDPYYNINNDINNKIIDTKAKVEDYLINNPLFSKCHNKNGEYYTVTMEKQLLLTNTLITYQTLKGTPMEKALTWNATGKASEVWTELEVLQLISEIKEYVQPITLLQQHLEEKIKNCKTKKDIDNLDLTINHAIANEILKDILNVDPALSEPIDTLGDIYKEEINK